MNEFSWNNYEAIFIETAKSKNKNNVYIKKHLDYAKKLYEKKLPIIYDAKHFSKLVGIHESYFYEVSNSQKYYYRTFKINKSNGSLRTIHEPLPNLKIIQQWILENILYNIEVSRFAKAYIKNRSIKDNVRFHKNKKYVLKLDIKSFFPSIKGRHIYIIFNQLGYTPQLTKLFMELCVIHNRLPQGAPTSAYLSNLVLLNFDKVVSDYCVAKDIRYTRYADDMTFSGNFDVKSLITFIERELAKEKLLLNKNKTRLLKQNNRQLVTGITVNEKIQVARPYRKNIRLEMYYINKYGLSDHLNHNQYNQSRYEYIKALLGKVNYCLYINPEDTEMKKYKKELRIYKRELHEESNI